MHWNYNCGDCPKKKEYQIVIMDPDGKATYGKTFESWNDIFYAMIKLRDTYAEMEISCHVGYREV